MKVRRIMLSVVAVGAITGVTGIMVLRGQDTSRIAQLQTGNVVVRISPGVGVTDTIYVSPLWSTRHLSISPSGELLGLVEIQEGEGGVDPVRSPRWRLAIFDWAGDVKTVLQDVHRYTWCCDDMVVAILGPYREGGVGFSYRGVGMLDGRTGEQTAIEFPEPVRDLASAQFDGGVYFLAIRDPGRVLRLDPETQAATTTEYRGIRFSPSGRYYLYYDAAGTPDEYGWHIVERQSGREIPLPDTSLGGVQGWAFGSGDQLLLARTQVTDYQVHGLVASGSSRVIGYTVFDVLRRAVSQTVQGQRLPNAVADGDGFAVQRDGEIAVIRRVNP